MDGADLKQEELGIVRLCGHQAFAHMVTGFGQDSYISEQKTVQMQTQTIALLILMILDTS